nr:hypothetical protein Paeru_mt_17 [Porphyridium aerugineum]
MLHCIEAGIYFSYLTININCLKTISLLIIDQLWKDNSMLIKGLESTIPSYFMYGKANELFYKFATVFENKQKFNDFFFSLVLIFYIMKLKFGKTCEWGIRITNQNAKEYLTMKYVTLENSGSSEKGNFWDDGGFIVLFKTISKNGKKSSQSSDNVFMPSGLKALITLRHQNKENKNFINNKVIDIVSNLDVLLVAYTKIKFKLKYMTLRTDYKAFEELHVESLTAISKQLNTGIFKFQSVSKVNNKIRDENVILFFDKIVQEAIRMILEAIFENSFSIHSHGLRTGKSCHTVFYEIKKRFGLMSWFIKKDISTCFESFNNKLLIAAVNTRIKDQVFIDLLYKLIKVGYIDFTSVFDSLNKGLSQDSIVSPILCNIYLDKLDQWLENYTKIFNKKIKCYKNLEYGWFTRKNSQSRALYLKSIYYNHINTTYYANSSFKCMRFIRYAHNIFIGVVGTKQDCSKIINDFIIFIVKSLNLTFYLKQAKITHVIYDKTFFLGTKIYITKRKTKFIKHIKKANTAWISKISPRLQFFAPISHIVQKLNEKGFCRKGSHGFPTCVGKFMHYSLDIVYNIVLCIVRGYLNYYSFVDNYARLKARLIFILKYSLALTLTKKFKLRTLKKTFKKFGNDLQVIVNTKIVKFDQKSFPQKASSFQTNINENLYAEFHKLIFIIPRILKLFREKASYKIQSIKRLKKIRHILPKEFHELAWWTEWIINK